MHTSHHTLTTTVTLWPANKKRFAFAREARSLPSARFWLKLLSMLILATHTLACGAGADDANQGEDNQWTVSEQTGEEMSSPVIEDMHADSPDIIREEEDAGSALDLGTPEDMPIVLPEEDMAPETPDAAPDMPTPPPVLCEDSGFEIISAPQRITGRLAQGVGISLLDTPCGTLAHTRTDSYTLRVEREALIDIWLEQNNADNAILTPRLILDQGCDPLEEGALLGCGGHYGGPRIFGRAATLRQKLSPGDYTITVAEDVDEDNPFAYGGRYELRVAEITPAPHGTCEDARALPPGQRLEEVSEGGGDQGTHRSCFQGNNLMYYTVEVPAGQAVTIEADHPTLDRSVGIDIDTGCEKHAQSLCATDGSQNRLISSVVNDSDTAREYIVALDVAMGAPYWVEANLYTPYENGSCELPLSVEPGQTSPVQSWEGAGPEERLCYDGNRGRALYYSVDVPPMHRLYPDSLTISWGCDAATRTCPRAPHANTDTVPWIATIMTSTQFAGAGDTSQITPYLVPLAPNSMCANPTPLTVGQTLTGQEIKSGLEAINACAIVLSGSEPMLYYTVDVDLGEEVRVIAEADDPRFNQTLSVQVVNPALDPAQCDTGTCVTSSDGYFRPGTPAEVIIPGTIGGGQGTATALVMVSMGQGHDQAENTTFSIRVEPVTP